MTPSERYDLETDGSAFRMSREGTLAEGAEDAPPPGKRHSQPPPRESGWPSVAFTLGPRELFTTWLRNPG